MPTVAASSRIRAHPVVGRERLALHDADLGEVPEDLGVGGADGFVLDQRVDGLPEPEVVRGDGVERHAASLDERGVGDVDRGCGERAALEERADAGARPTLRVGVHLERRLDGRHRRRGIAVLHERAAQHQDPVGARVPDEEAALGERAVVAGGNEEELAAGAAVGAGETEVDDPLEPHVVERAQRHRRRLDDHRAVVQVDDHEVVDGVGVRGQEPRRRVHQLREDQDACCPRTPMPRKPSRMAQVDAAGNAVRNPFSACT